MDELALIKAALASKDPDLWVAAHKLVSSPYYQFRPRPDRPDLLDEQSSFVNDQFGGIACVLGGNRCLAGEQEIFDPVAREYLRIDRIKTDFYVWSRDESGRRVIARSSRPFVKGVDDLYEVALSNGESFRCTLGHRVLTPAGFCDVRRLSVGDLLVSNSDTSPSGSQPGGLRCSGTASGCRCCCSPGRRRCGGPLLPAAGGDPGVAPSPAGAPGCSPLWLRPGGPAGGPECTPPCPRPGRRSNWGGFLGTTPRSFASGNPTVSTPCLSPSPSGSSPDRGVHASTAANRVTTVPPPPRLPSCPTCTCRSSRRAGTECPVCGPGSRPAGTSSPQRQGRVCTRAPGAPASMVAIADPKARPQSHDASGQTLPSRPFQGGETCTSCPVFSLTTCPTSASDNPISSARRSRFCPKGGTHDRGGPTSTGAIQARTGHQQCPERFCPKCTSRSSVRGAKGRVLSCVSITSIQFIRKDVFYDITVPPHANYEVAGVWHHNSGKSRCSAYKVARLIRNTPPPDKTTRFWVICQTMEMACGICWAQHLEEFLPEARVTGWYSEAKGYPSSVVYDHPGGTGRWMLEFKSYDMGRAALQAAAIGGFWADEQVPHSLLSEIVARTSNYRIPGSKIYSLTPLKPDYDLETVYAEQEKYPGWKFYRMNTLANTTIDHGFLDFELEELRETRTTGVFASYSGSIYKTFSTTQHVVEPFEIPLGWTRAAGIDFGWDHPTTVVFVARSPSGKFVVYQEYVENKTSIEEHVAAIKSLWPPHRDNGVIWADHAAQERHEFAIRGLPTRAAHKDVLAGIARTQHLLRSGPDGKPGLTIFKTCPNLIRELRTYSWHPTIPNRVLKENDDCADSLRYALAGDGQEYKPIDGLRLDQHRFFKKTLRRR